MSTRTIAKLAVLDRGESAVRVLLAVAELNERTGGTPVATVAVHADSAENAWFAREADEVIVLGPGLSVGEPDGRRRSHLLDVDAVVALLREAGVDAVWLGHGVVENHLRLAESCEAAGLLVVGPPAATVRLIDDRVAFRRTLAAAGLPLLPWSDGPVDGVEAAAAVADRLGYPVRLLASAASGRRGITSVATAADLPAAFAQAQDAARRESGDGALLVEADLGPARRVEVTVLADDAGVVWTLDVRETSLRRRHQRVLLESPVPTLSAAMSDALRSAAADVCAAIGYRNAGAVRFVVAPDGERFFVTGVDARLELDHAITEELCGIDVVDLRLRLAAGGRLEAEPPRPEGFAIEARVLAQDPLDGFATTPGRVALLELPTGTGVRVDAGVRAGDLVSGEYEPLLATLTAVGRDRSEALTRLRRALERTSIVVDGGATDGPFLLGLLDASEVEDGDVDDAWLDAYVDAQRHVAAPDPLAVVVAAIEAYDDDRALADAAFLASAGRGRPSLRAEVGSRIAMTYHDVEYRVRVDRRGPDSYRVTPLAPASAGIDVRVETVNRWERRISCAGRRHRVQASLDAGAVTVVLDGAAHQVTRSDGVVVRAPSPAFVVSLAVGPGDHVAAGDPVAVVESMKMETTLTSMVDGVVVAVDVMPNAQVDGGAPLLRVRTTEPDDAVAAQPVPGNGQALDLASLAAGAGPGAASGAAGGPSCQRVYTALRDYLLGYDCDPASLKAVLAQQKSLAGSCPPADPDLVQCEDGLLDLYADLAALYRPRTQGFTEDANLLEINTQEYLVAYLQWLDPDRAGLPSAYRERLLAALGRYGVTGLHRSPELEAAAVRLFASVSRLRELAPVVVAVLQRRLTERDALAPVLGSGLRARLDRLAAATQGRFQVVADLARDVRFHYIDEPVLEGIVKGVLAEADGHLEALAAAPLGAARDEHIAALVACPQPLRGLLLNAYTSHEDADFRHAVLEAYARRFYRIRALGQVQRYSAGGHVIGAAEYPLEERIIHLVTAFVPLHELPQLATHVGAHLAAVPRDREVVVDVVAWRPGERPDIDQTAAEVSRQLESCTFGRPLHRLDVTVTSTSGAGPEHFRTQHLTYRQGVGYAFVEETIHRNLHPMLAKRLSMWRLSNFQLKRLPSAEDIYLFDGVAHENPKDRRLFALAEVRDLTPVTDEGSGRVGYPMLERMGLQALAAMRDALASIPDRERPVANRIVLDIRPPWDVPRSIWSTLARAFAPLAAGAGLEKVVLRVRIPVPEGMRESVLHVEGIAEGGVRVREEAPGNEPIRALTPYRQKVLLSARFGAPYPFEITRLLAPDAGTAGAFPPGRFVEHELVTGSAEDGSDDTLAPVDRAPGNNTAHLVVGLITSFTDKVPEGMTRVAILSDPTKGLGNLAEPECRRINAALALAASMKVPVEWFACSSGALIAMDSGTENMDWIALTLRRLIEFTQGGGEVNVVVTGINVGGQPYWNAESTMLMHTKGILVMTPSSAMVLTGKQALDFSGGVSAEDNFGIGGYDHVMGPNGQGQYWAPSLEGACTVLLRHYDHAYVVPGERFPRRRPTSDPIERDIKASPHKPVPGSDFTVVGDVFDRNPDRKKPFDMRSVMRAVADADSEPLERWQRWRGGENSIVWDAHVGGIPVCMLGLESRTTPRRGYVPADGPVAWTSGTLFPQASRKTARAVNAASGNRPLVVLANLSGFDGSPESMRRTQLEYGAEIGRAVTNFRGPIVFVVVSRYHGGAFVVFSKALNPAMQIAAVEGSFASVIGGAPAAATVFAREVKQRTEKDPRVAAVRDELAAASGAAAGVLRAKLQEVTEAVRSEKLGEVAGEFDGIHTIERAKQMGSVDEIIAAPDVRPWVVAALERGMAQFAVDLEVSVVG